MYDKYTARPAVFLSCNFIDFSPFYSALGIVFGGPKRYFCTFGERNKQAKDNHFCFLRKMIGQKRSL